MALNLSSPSTEAKRIKVIWIAPAQTVRGGITSLIDKVGVRLQEHVELRIITTISKYTGTGHPQRGSWLFQGMVFLRALLSVLSAGIFDREVIFHVHLSMKGGALRKGLVCVGLRLMRCRYVVHGHAAEESLFHDWIPELARRVLLWGIRGADYFIALTNFWSSYYAKVVRLPANKLLCLSNPAVLPASIPTRTNSERINLLFLGRIGQRKGAFETIQAFAALPDDIRMRSHLTLAGDGERDAARALAEDLGCSPQTSVLDWVERREADRLLADTDIFLLPSRGEGMSMALLEAMAWGLPIVTTASGGTEEFLTSDHNCILVEPGNIQDIAKAVQALTLDSQLRLRLGREARKTASAFSIENYVAKLTRLYTELASDSRGSNGDQPVFSENCD